MATETYLAIDLGASGGRVLAGELSNDKIRIEPIHRFPNGPVYVGRNMHWDVLGLWHHVQEGLRAAGEKYGKSIRSLGVDTWGVDYALLGRGDVLLGNPYHYRDPQNAAAMEQALQKVSREDVFAATGLQFMQINTIYQLVALQMAESPLLDSAEHLLMIPDLFHWFLTGERAVEVTDASTSQLYNPQTSSWATDLIARLNLPTEIFGTLTPPGTRLGSLQAEVRNQTGLAAVDVVLPGSHDTASAVLAVPTQEKPSSKPSWCYISSGTWSLMGVELPAPIINDRCAAHNFTNEAGVQGTTRLLKNIPGLWPVQECRRIWSQQGKDFEWDELVNLAAAAEPLQSIVNLDDPRLVAPADMPAALAELCRETNQVVPENEGAFIRCALESLALRYRQVLAALEELTGSTIETIHIVGGGSQNALLSQMAADACNRKIITGPVEATAIGNCLMQIIAAGELASLPEARALVGQSMPLHTFHPSSAVETWDEPAQRLQDILQGSSS